jgi:hypothetical protein
MANITRPDSYNNWNKLLWDTGKMSYVEIRGKGQGSAKPEGSRIRPVTVMTVGVHRACAA